MTDLYDTRTQTWFVNQDLLPILVHNWYEQTPLGGYTVGETNLRALAPHWGLHIGEVVHGQFYRCALPAGWKKEAGVHSPYWTWVMDGKERTRARIFFCQEDTPKPSLILHHRFTAAVDVEDRSVPIERSRLAPAIRDDGTITWRGAWHGPLVGERPWIGVERIEQIARDELDRAFPDWRNPLKYW